MELKLKYYKKIWGTLTCKSGVRVGGSGENIEIGGAENTIIRHPITDEPYLPGSSIKGKVRSLLEYKYGRRFADGRTKGDSGKGAGEPCECGNCKLCKVFGPHKNTKHSLGPSRALFRDATLTDTSREILVAAQDKGVFYAEVKTENIVDRITGTAEHPRTLERVPSGTQFKFEISVRIFEADNEAEILGLLDEGLKLLQQDALGGSGSRGSGEVTLEYKIE